MPMSKATWGCVAAVSFVVPASAQWPSSPVTNLAVGDGAGQQQVPKIAATSDGGCYIVWYDGILGSALSIRAQRLDAAGNEQWPHGGVLVLDLTQTNLIAGWEIVRDSSDHCVIVFADTRTGVDREILAYRIAPDGTLVWGASGVVLSNNTVADDAPRVCEAHDGDFVVVWIKSTNTLQMQRISPAGTLRFPSDGVSLPAGPGAGQGFWRVVAGAAGTGDVIVQSVVHVPWVQFSAATLRIQKFDALGNALWNGGAPIVLLDQFGGNVSGDPLLVSDGAGGAVCAFELSSYSLRVQRVDGSGAEQFPHYGVDVSTNSNPRTEPDIVWVPSLQQVLVAWIERGSGWTTYAVVAQKLGATGASLWSPTGIVLMPFDGLSKNSLTVSPLHADVVNQGMIVGVLASNGVGLQYHLRVFGLTTAGSSAFAAVDASIAASQKAQLEVATSASGTQMLAWTDYRNGAADVYAAAVDARGALGVSLATATIGGCGGNPAGSLVVAGRPAIGMTMQWALTNPLGTQAAGSLGFFFLGTGTVGFPCGIAVPGFGMAGVGAPGEIVLDLNLQFFGFFAGTWSPPAPVAMTFAMPFDTNLIGTSLYVQGLMWDPSPGTPVEFGVSDGALLVVGS